MAGGDTPAVRQQRLRSELRRLREAAGFTQKEVADALEWSVSKVLRIETGASHVGTTDLRAMLAHYGVTDSTTVDELVEAARVGRKRTWRDKYRKYVDPQFYAFLGYEASAQRIRQYQSTAIPGLLQIESYIRALSEVFYDDKETFDRAVNIRLERQHILGSEIAGPQMTFLLDEAILHREVGDESVMRDQLRHIQWAAQLPNVTIQIVPFRTGGGHRGMGGPSFTIFDFADSEGDTVVFLEERHRDVMIRNNPQEIRRYEADFDAVAQRALPSSETKDVIDALLDNIE